MAEFFKYPHAQFAHLFHNTCGIIPVGHVTHCIQTTHTHNYTMRYTVNKRGSHYRLVQRSYAACIYSILYTNAISAVAATRDQSIQTATFRRSYRLASDSLSLLALKSKCSSPARAVAPASISKLSVLVVAREVRTNVCHHGNRNSSCRRHGHDVYHMWLSLRPIGCGSSSSSRRIGRTVHRQPCHNYQPIRLS